MTRAHFIYWGTAGGLSAKEVLLSVPGEVYDLFDLYIEAKGLKKKQDDDFE